jgi:TRAP-type mannitol/chloroaromatic compound transport system permease small subunit
MKWLRLAVRAIDASSDMVPKYVCWLILALMALTFYDVVMRYFFNDPTIWIYEFVGLLFGPLWLLVGAYLLTHDEHVRMDILWRRLTPRQQAIVDLVTYTLFLLYAILILIYGCDWFWTSLIRGGQSRTIWHPYLWPFKLFIPLGVGLMLLAGIAKYIRDFYMAITGRRLD